MGVGPVGPMAFPRAPACPCGQRRAVLRLVRSTFGAAVRPGGTRLSRPGGPQGQGRGRADCSPESSAVQSAAQPWGASRRRPCGGGQGRRVLRSPPEAELIAPGSGLLLAFCPSLHPDLSLASGRAVAARRL